MDTTVLAESPVAKERQTVREGMKRMRCPHCGANSRTFHSICPHCGHGISVRKSKALHLYRDRRHRQYILRRILLGAMAIALLLVLTLLAFFVYRLISAHTIPHPEPTPQITAEPTPAPTAEPQTVELPEGAVYSPIPDIATREELVDLYRWMIDSGNSTVALDSLTLDKSEIHDISDKFSNYFNAYKSINSPAAIRVEFKPGLRALQAIQSDCLDDLPEDIRRVAEQAKALVEEIIEPGMSDWEKELVLHDYVLAHCDYAVDVTTTHTGDAIGFFQYGKCRCAGYVDTFRLLGRLAGLEVEMIGGPTNRDSNGSKGHAWNLVRLDGLWYVLDASWDDLIENVPTIEHTFFNVPVTCFGGSRSWDQSCCPEGEYAQALDEKYYFYRPEYIVDNRTDAVSSAIRQLDSGGSAYLMLPSADLAKEVSEALVRHYGKKGSCYELSEDLTFHLFRYRLN